MKTKDLLYLDRCCDLARLGGAAVSPNPRVGAVLVYQDRIIGEGFHKKSGTAHAEVNCINSVKPADQPFIPHATIYVSLEPCCFHGRTPACTSLILNHKIKKVVIGQFDQTPKVNGQGVSILTSAGVTVKSYPEHIPSQQVAQERQIFAAKQRPFVLLKYAQSADGFIAPKSTESYWISSKLSRVLTHRWRAQTGAILVGAATVLKDDPQLNTRLYPGPSPLRVILDPKGRCSGQEKVFQHVAGQPTTLWFRPAGEFPKTTAEVFAIKDSSQDWVPDILTALYNRKIHHLTVEGGRATLELFLDNGNWDEARRFTNPDCHFGTGLPAPDLGVKPAEVQKIDGDILERFFPNN